MHPFLDQSAHKTDEENQLLGETKNVKLSNHQRDHKLLRLKETLITNIQLKK